MFWHAMCKEKHMGNIRKNMLWNAFGNIVYLGLQWLVTVIVTRLRGYSDAGMLSTAMSVTAVFQTAALFGIRAFQTSDVTEKYSDSCYAGLRGLTCAAALALCMIFSAANLYGAAQMLSIFWFMLFRLAEDYSDVLHGIAQRKDRLDIAGKAFAIKGIASFAAFLAVMRLSGSMTAGLAAMALSSILTTFLYDLRAVRKISSFKLRDSWKSCITLAGETVPLFVYLFLSSSVSAMPKYLLEKMCGGDALGAYSAIYAPALLVQAAAQYLYMPFITPLADMYAGRDFKGFRKTVFGLSAAIAAAAAIAMTAAKLFGTNLLILIFTPSIEEFAYLLIPILVCTFLLAYFSFFCAVQVIVRDFRGLIAGCASGFVLCAAAIPLSIKAFGINGASIGFIAGISAPLIFMAARIAAASKSREDIKNAKR